MKFEHPNILFFFFLLLIPIILHLFNFRKYKTLYFSNLLFIKKIEEENQSTRKLKKLLILISRLLFLTFLILAFAQPFVPNLNKSKGKNLYCFYVDNSFSMALQGTSGELFSMAKERIRKIVNDTERDANFILVSNQFDGLEQQVLSKSDFLENLEKLEYSPLKKSLGSVVQFVQNAIENDINNYDLKMFLLSDFQKNNLKKNNFNIEKQFTIFPIQLIAQKYENLSIDSVWFDKPNFRKGVNNELFIKVKNYSNEDIYNLEVGIEINKTKRNALCDILKNSEKIISINYTDQESGLKKGKVWIDDKNILFDDNFYFSYNVKENSPILVVDGEDAVSNINSVYLLEKYFLLNKCSQNNFTPEKIENINLIVLNGLNDVSEAASSMLLDFVNSGGSIAVFPGSNIDFKKYNYFLQKLNLPSLQKLSSNSYKVKELAYQDEFFKGVFESKPKNLLMPLQNKIYPINNNKSSFLPLISYENGQALFLKHINKSIYLFCSPLIDDAGNFKKNALFSTILLRMAEMSSKAQPLYMTIGSSQLFPISIQNNNELPLKLKSVEIEFVPQQYRELGNVYISVESSSMQKSQKSGYYEVISDKSEGIIALNDNREESQIYPAEKDEVNKYLINIGFKDINYSTYENENDLIKMNVKKELVYWRLFLFFALIFILIELMLIKWMKD